MIIIYTTHEKGEAWLFTPLNVGCVQQLPCRGLEEKRKNSQ